MLSFSFVLQCLVSDKFHFKRKCSTFRRAGSNGKTISLQDSPRVVTVTVRDRKILLLPDPVRLWDFQDTARSQTEKNNEKSDLLPSPPQGAANKLKRKILCPFTADICQLLSFTLNFAYSSSAFSFSFSLPFSSFHVCRHIQRVHEFIAFFKIFRLFF